MRIVTMAEAKHKRQIKVTEKKKRTEVCAICIKNTEDRFADSGWGKDGFKGESQTL